jgi:Dicarboxylate transport
MLRRITIGLCVTVLIAAAAIGAALVHRVALASWLVRHALSRAGFPHAALSIDRLDADGATVTGLASGDELRVDRLELTFDFYRLPQLPLERVRIVGARIDLTRPVPSGKTGEAAGSSGFPTALLPALELDDVVVVTSSPVGPVFVKLQSHVEREAQALRMQLDGAVENQVANASIRGEARLEPGGAVSMSVQMSSVTVRHPRLRIASGTASARFDGESSGFDVKHGRGRIEAALHDVTSGSSAIGEVIAALPLEVSHDAEGWAAKLAGAELRLPGRSLRFSAISGEASARVADIRAERIEDIGKDRRFEPLSLHFHVADAAPLRRFTADLAAASGRAAMHAEGGYDPGTGTITIDVSLPRISFDPAGLEPASISPLLAELGAAKGALSAAARLHWASGKGVDGTASLGFDHLSIDAERLRVDDLEGKVELVHLRPPQTAGTQTAHVRELHPGVAFSDAELRWALEPLPDRAGSRLLIESFAAGFAGGHVAVRDALLDPLAAQNRIDFRLEEVDVAKLFAIASLEGVSGTGRLSGTIPVLVRGSAVAIAKSELTAQGGVLQMRSQRVASVLSGGGQSVQLLLDALADFHYDQLTVTIEKDFAGEAAVRVHLEGNNPGVLGGRAFRINLNLSGNLDRLIASLLEIARLSDRAVRATVGGLKPEGR